jgi:hypothetical protein
MGVGVMRDYYHTKKKDESPEVVYYEPIKRDLNTRRIYESRCDERLKVKSEGSTRLPYTELSIPYVSSKGSYVVYFQQN